MSKFVQIRGDQVVTISPCRQDPAYWPDIVDVEDDDPRYMAFLTMTQTILTGLPTGEPRDISIEARDQSAASQP